MWKSLFEVKRKWDSQLQKYLRHCTVFWLKLPVHDLVLVIPPPPLFKVAGNTRPCSKHGGTTLNGGGEGRLSILSHRPVTSSDLKQDRLFFSWECLNIFATGWSFSNDDGDGNQGVKKATGLSRKTTTLHVHHACLYTSLPSLHDYDVKMPNCKFYGGHKQATTNLFFSL